MQQPDHPSARKNAVELRNQRTDIERLESEILSAIEARGYPKESQFAIRLALEEGITNAFQHGHRDRPDDPIRVEWSVEPASVEITIEDRGPGFEPAAIPDPTLEENITLPTGRGIMLMRAYMTEIHHNETGNRVTMRYTHPKSE